jgi:adenine/guanine/hypoxanthine permease
MRLVVNDPQTDVSMGDIYSSDVILGMCGVSLIAFLEHKHWNTAYLIPIIIMTAIGWGGGYAPLPHTYISLPQPDDFFISFDALSLSLITPVVALFMIALFDTAGIMYGVRYMYA